jgi:hypothetical protein
MTINVRTKASLPGSLPIGPTQGAALMACDDPLTLQRWLSRAKAAGSAAEVFSVNASTKG